MSFINKNNVFYSKILLFGEYSILFDSNGLTIPYAHFNGSLNYINTSGYTDLDYAKRSNRQLLLYAEYLDGKSSELIDINLLKKDIKKGLYFESSIPEGYGLGSSGALVAALYKKYGNNKIEAKAGLSPKETSVLKETFSILESYFHGQSSGIDPLICYLKHPLFIKNQNHISSIGISRKNIRHDDAVFMVNTKMVGKTAPLVDLFMKKCLKHEYITKIKNELIPTTNNCIQSLLAGDLNTFYKNLKLLSKFQLNYLKEMIPVEFIKYWEKGITNNDYLLKLCGSGGGGYLLGFTRQFSKVKKDFTAKGLEIIPVYQEF
ncbi:mevalonate kinase family protein [Plebeiibacterium marinum]|uniref:mevalonate kinase n=1 Tax=Plebeiibacterium marinum TaxID=2992111 RepID=A0AAE3MFV6_9BACT|nr:mevalonate kinase [Plebeiobacterium marinum]MCW3806835.1 mevalonate kinase [Plebeiobacterium marinum]